LPALLWAFPVFWGIPLLLGFFHFLLGVALVFALLAAWARLPRVGMGALLLLAAAVALALFVHRGAALLLLLLAGCLELAHRLADPAGWRHRWSLLPPLLPPAALLAAALFIAWRTAVILFPGREPNEPAVPRSPLGQLAELRPLLLFDATRERPWLVALGALGLVAVLLAAWTRRRHGPRWHRWDGLLLAALVLLMATFLLRSPHAHLFYLVERAQWLALLLAGLWAMAFVPRPALLPLAAALLLVHVPRTVQVGRDMGHFAHKRADLRSIARQLPPGAVVVPVDLETNWLHMHQGAFIAALHQGVHWGPVDHMLYRYGTYPSTDMVDYTFKRTQGWHWLTAHLHEGRPPRVDALLLLGKSPPEAWGDRHAGLQELLDEHFMPGGEAGELRWYRRR
jgi:hypothetical protein